MSWLARSLASSLRLSSSDDEQEPATASERASETQPGSDSESDNTNRTVKEDISDLTQNLTRQFWGVASFLSSQNPQSDSSSCDGHPAVVESPRIDGIKSDFAEIGNHFKSSISLISTAKVVTEVSKIATSFLQFGSDEDKIDEKVVVFVKNLTIHPKTWVDFPEFDAGELELSEAQEKHILAIEHLVPELTDLKNELCPSCMPQGRFWMIYFLLLIPTLRKDEAEFLSSPQIMKARVLLLEGSHDKPNNQTEQPGTNSSDTVIPTVRQPSSEEKVILPVQTEELFPQTFDAHQIIDKTVTDEELMTDKNYSWSEEEIDEAAQATGKIDTDRVGQVEVDVSFSDLEEDDDDDFIIKVKRTVTNKNKDGTGTVTGSSPGSYKSSEWLDVDDLVVD